MWAWALKPAVDLPKSEQLLLGIVSGLGEDRIKDRASMSLAEDETVAVRPGWVLGPMPEHTEVEGR